ncbi:MAG: DNA-binding protein, partial [Deltaproteobacteria bacterium]
MNDASYKKLCIANILNGVTEGLSKYSRPTRVALIFAASPDDPVSIFDPQGLLRGHESKLEDIFFANGDQWRLRIKETILSQPRNHLIPENDLELSGLISYGGSASDFFYQMWFTEHHPDMCSVYPTERWLEQSSSLLVHDYNTRNAPINSSDYVLKNYSLQAVADHIVDVWNKFLEIDCVMQIPPILNNILNISKTREEGAWARGVLFFTDPRRISSLSFLTKIQKHERPMVSNVKHIRKLLVAVERSDRKLVSDGKTIIGITDSMVPESAIVAEFNGDYGFLRMGNEKIASFFDGSFHSTTREAKLVELEELLLDSKIETEASTLLFRVVSQLVHKAGHARHGCTLVIDLNTS